MSEKDFMIGTVAAPTAGSTISKKPHYLVTLEDSKGKVTHRFIALDLPVFHVGFIQAKGIYTDNTEEEIIKKFSEIVVGTPKEQQVEIFFPAHKISSIRSLVFNAVKPVMVNK